MSPVNGSVAPSCPISRSQPTARTPSITVANIPKANDLRTALDALRALKYALQHITRGVPQVNNVAPVRAIPPPAPQYARLSWHETGRGYTQQRVANPDDLTEFVAIKTLSFVQWQDDVTGSTIRYKGQG